MSKNLTVFKSVEDRLIEGQHSKFGRFHGLFVKAKLCAWGGKCIHCTYWHDNTKNEETAVEVNRELIDLLVPKYRTIGLYPSASFFDIPVSTIEYLFTKVCPSNLISESTWTNRDNFSVAEDMIMHLSEGHTTFWHKMGIESFDNDVRASIGKNYVIDNPMDVFGYTKSVILLVGTKFHTRDVIDRDIELALEHASMIDVNIIDDTFSSMPIASNEMIEYTLDRWGDILNADNRCELTLSPSFPWKTAVNA